MITKFCRNFSTSGCKFYKIAIHGASGRIGQTISVFMKMNPMVSEVRLQDCAKNIEGVALDISHIESPPDVTGFQGGNSLKQSITCADVVICTAGGPLTKGVNKEELFRINAGIIKNLAITAAEVCPKGIFVIVTDPVNSMVPLMVEIMKNQCIEGAEKRVVGVTAVDNVRANVFAGKKIGVSPIDVNVPVIGGHTSETIIPLFSKATPKICLDTREIEELTCRVRVAAELITEKKKCTGSDGLSVAYATTRFVNSILRALKGDEDIVECAFAKSEACPIIPFFAGPTLFGKHGIEDQCIIQNLTDFETELLSKAIPVLQLDIKKGIKFAIGNNSCSRQKKEDICQQAERKKLDVSYNKGEDDKC